MAKESRWIGERVVLDGEVARLLGRARGRHGVQGVVHMDRCMVSEDYVLYRPAKNYTRSALL